MPQVPIRSLLKVLTITLIMHVCSTGMRFTATLDAINSGASTFWVGAMLASISLGPMCFAIPSGRWLNDNIREHEGKSRQRRRSKE